MGRPLAPPVKGGAATSRVPLAGPLGSSEPGPKLNRTTSRPGWARISTFVIRSEGSRPVWRSMAHAAAEAATDAVGVEAADGVAIGVAVAGGADGVGVWVGTADALGAGVVVPALPHARSEIAMTVAQATALNFMPAPADSERSRRRRRRAATQERPVSSRVDLPATPL